MIPRSGSTAGGHDAAGREISGPEFRTALGHFPTGVVAVTSRDDRGAPLGLAVGSFTSVSLDPPLVAFLPGKSSSTYPKIERTGEFCINVLSARQEALCRSFAFPGKKDKFEGVAWRPSPAGLPILEETVAWIDCGIEAVHDAGDHLIVIGRVRDLGVENPTLPLVFFQGGYGAFAPASIALGSNPAVANSILITDRARAELAALATELDAECRLLARAEGFHYIVAASRGVNATQSPTHLGRRLPFVPPWGTVFLAWAPEDEVEAWYRSGSVEPGTPRREGLDRELAAIRERGWAYTPYSDQTEQLQAIYDQLDAHGPTPALERQLRAAVESADPGAARSGTAWGADDRSTPAIQSLRVPVFGPDGAVELALSASGLSPALTRAEVEELAARLIRSAAAISDSLAAARGR